MFVDYRLSGLGREQGTKNETFALQDPKQVPKPNYEATALHVFHDMSHGDIFVDSVEDHCLNTERLR